jgi:hypothetical protein
LLQAHFGSRLLLDYEDTPIQKNWLHRNLVTLKGPIAKRNIHKEYDCIHGHFLPMKYSLGQKNMFLVWLRDPAERVASRYFHWRRQIEKGNNQNFHQRKIIKKEDMSLYEFASIKRYQNLYAKYLWNFRLEKFAFIGIVEKFEKSIEVFEKQFNIKANNIAIENTNPQKAYSKSYQLEPELRDLIYQNNRKDLEIYQKALYLNQQSQKRLLNH